MPRRKREFLHSDFFFFFVLPSQPPSSLSHSSSSPPFTMSSTIPINQIDPTAPTPQNTPLTQAPLAAGLSRPTVPDISEDNEEEDAPAPGDDLQNAVMGLVQGKLAGLVGKSSGYIESLPVEVKLNVEALKGVQVKQIELQNQYKRECLELEKKVSFIHWLILLSIHHECSLSFESFESCPDRTQYFTGT